MGRRYPPCRNYLGMTWVREFLKTVGASNTDALTDEIPNAFLPALRDGPFEVFTGLKVPLKCLLHISQEYDYKRPLKANQWVDSETEISDFKEKTSKLGSIYILDLKTSFSQSGELCAQSVMRVFVRRQDQC